MPHPSPAEIESYRQQHVGRLLGALFRSFNAESLRRLRARGHPALTAAHLAVLPYVDASGTRLTTLAERADMTKQAAGQLVAELEARGYLQRAPDPHDRRASLLRFTPLGDTFLRDAFDLKHEVEGEFRALLGEARFTEFQQALRDLTQGWPGRR